MTKEENISIKENAELLANMYRDMSYVLTIQVLGEK